MSKNIYPTFGEIPIDTLFLHWGIPLRKTGPTTASDTLTEAVYTFKATTTILLLEDARND
jgi:hypothetical protein